MDMSSFSFAFFSPDKKSQFPSIVSDGCLSVALASWYDADPQRIFSEVMRARSGRPPTMKLILLASIVATL
jgi:hypothetical protein